MALILKAICWALIFITRIYEYTPPPRIIILGTALVSYDGQVKYSGAVSLSRQICGVFRGRIMLESRGSLKEDCFLSLVLNKNKVVRISRLYTWH